MRQRWLALAVLWAAACGSTAPSAFRVARAEAERAYAHGRYREAAAHWERAASLADDERDRSEARYRQAASLLRAGHEPAARATLERIAEDADSERRARAAFELGLLEIRQGREGSGHEALRRFLFAHPASGLAGPALDRYLRWLERTEGPNAARAFLDSAITRLGESELDERLRYRRAQLLLAAGEAAEAAEAFRALAERHPYPHGAFWDDALYRAARAELERRPPHPQRALEHLSLLLAEREPAHLQGSYERARFADGQYLVAEIYRDHLGDPRRAAAEFRVLWAEFETSLLRDDALWQAALIGYRLGDATLACELVDLLESSLPDSRYASCGYLICNATPQHAACRSYIVRSVRAESNQTP